MVGCNAGCEKWCNLFVNLREVAEARDAKCHGYDGLIRVKILASWGKSLGEHTILKNEAFFGGDLHNLCEMALSKLS